MDALGQRQNYEDLLPPEPEPRAKAKARGKSRDPLDSAGSGGSQASDSDNPRARLRRKSDASKLTPSPGGPAPSTGAVQTPAPLKDTEMWIYVETVKRVTPAGNTEVVAERGKEHSSHRRGGAPAQCRAGRGEG